VQPLLQWKSSITYFEYVCVALGFQHSKSMRHIVICGLFVSTNIFPRGLLKNTIFEKEKKKKIELKMCALIFYTTFVWNIFRCEKNWARYDQKCVLVFMYISRYSCHIWMKLEFSWQIFEKYPHNQIFNGSQPSGGRVVPCGRTDKRADMTELIVALRHFAKAPNKTWWSCKNILSFIVS
jgi:hypothetical protein